MSGKRYPEEFKIEAVKQVVDRGHSVSSVGVPRPLPPKVPPSLDNKLNFIEKEAHF